MFLSLTTVVLMVAYADDAPFVMPRRLASTIFPSSEPKRPDGTRNRDPNRERKREPRPSGQTQATDPAGASVAMARAVWSAAPDSAFGEWGYGQGIIIDAMLDMASLDEVDSELAEAALQRPQSRRKSVVSS